MNLDFILFAGPKIKYQFIDLWGEVVFIPSYVPKGEKTVPKNQFLSEFVNCYKAKKNEEVQISIESAINDLQGQTIVNESQGTTNSTASEQFPIQFQINHYIPCLYLDSMVKSKYIILYFHASGEDIKIAHGLLNFLRNSYQTSVIAMEYKGYSIYQGSTKSEIVINDAKTVYDYLCQKMGYKQQNIIVVGRSIGTGVALELLKKEKSQKKQKKIIKRRPRALVLISPFGSVKNLAQEYIGKLGTFLAKEQYNNIQNISGVQCPVFMVHGKKDSLISYEHSKQILKQCESKSILVTPEQMTHSAFDYYNDLVDPLRQFLLEEGINFYEQNMDGPIISDKLFQCPQDFPI